MMTRGTPGTHRQRDRAASTGCRRHPAEARLAASLLGLLGSIFCFAGVGLAATYHVAPGGNDASSGLPGAPWRTIGKALAAASAGDSVLIAAGTYRELLTFSRSGTAAAPITFRNESGQQPIIDGTGLGAAAIINLSGVSQIKLSGLTLRGGATDCLYIGGSSRNIDITDFDISNCGGSGLWVQTTGAAPNFLTVRRSKAHDNGKGGITTWLSPGGYILIEGNEVYNNAGIGNYDGIQVGGGDGSTHHVVVRGNLVYGNGQGGGGADQIDLGGHAFGDYFLVEDNDVRGPGGDLKVQQGWGGKTMISRHNRLTGVGMAIYAFPSPSTIYNNTVVGGSHGMQFWSDFGNDPLPGRSFGGLEFKNNLLLQEGGDYLFLVNGNPGFHIDVRYSSMRLRSNMYRFTTKGILWYPRIFDTSNPSIGAAEFAAYQAANAPDLQDVGSQMVTGPATSILADPAALNYHLRAGSPAIDAGRPLTTTAAAGTNQTVVPLVRSTYFQDGWSGLNAPDLVRVGANAPVAVAAVDITNKTITLVAPITWSSGDPVSLPFVGSNPDVGAFEYGAVLESPTLLSVDPLP